MGVHGFPKIQTFHLYDVTGHLPNLVSKHINMIYITLYAPCANWRGLNCCYKLSTTVGNHPPTYMHLLYARFMETNHELERKIWKGSVFELAATSTSNICIFSFYFRERKMLYITTLENNV